MSLNEREQRLLEILGGVSARFVIYGVLIGVLVGFALGRYG